MGKTVVIGWELTASREEEAKVNFEIGMVLRMVLPYVNRVVYADSEGVRLLVDEAILTYLMEVKDRVRYLDIDVQDI